MKGKISMQGHREHSEIADAICEQTQAIRGILDAVKDEGQWWRSRRGLATKNDLQEMETRIMSVLSDYAGKVKAFNDRISAAIDGLSNDVEALTAKITELQNSPGAITPEDQALLDEAQAQAEALATKAEALDQMNPPTPPPA